MASGIIADESKQLLLSERTGNPPFVSAVMGLSTGNITPDHATTLATLLATELAVAGYARQSLANWTPPGLTGDFHAVTYADQVTFHNGSGGATGTVYTWWFMDVINTKLICSGRFATPFSIAAGADFKTTPLFQLTGE